jgi:preprotein translocase subunit SecG
MDTIILVIHMLIGVALVGVVLLQRSEGGLGGLGGGGGMGSLLGNRQTANLLTRATAALAGLFMVTSVSLAILAGSHGGEGAIVEEAPAAAHETQAVPETTQPAAPAVPTSE